MEEQPRPVIDMNELKKRDPLAYHRSLAITRAGELRVYKEEVSSARNSVERERAQRKVDQAKADVEYHRRHARSLSNTGSATDN